jgi:hypothetical protein
MFVYLQNSQVENITLKVIVLVDVAFGRWLGHESGAFIMVIVLIKETIESYLAM